ncbi:hypothetical protein [Flavobacterium sp. 1355]|uniref:hypothetical protein n=1 Tax=Flavobacterium sp. 1355 TaxID=2806571 RepID=UPI001AE49A40|nr:hypothetical protein [Flavobacterium sp. 1355]MBP1222030.1 hypothetical protein [Flavobacterium sp. 1355]
MSKDIKFATYNSDKEDIILSEYLIVFSIRNGASFNQLLECVNEIENLKEREVKSNHHQNFGFY